MLAIIRADDPHNLIPAAEAIRKGGITALEVSLTTPGALDVVERVKDRLGDEVVFGVGTVLEPDTAQAALERGADFIVSPTFSQEILDLCELHGVPYIPGALTPTEVIRAWQAGGELVKLFPASLGGPSYLKAITAPLPQASIIAVGGVDAGTIKAYLSSGAEAVGVGSSLIRQELLDANDFDELERRARHLLDAVEEARSG